MADAGFTKHIPPVGLAVCNYHADNDVLIVCPVRKSKDGWIPECPPPLSRGGRRIHGDVEQHVWETDMSCEAVWGAGAGREILQDLRKICLNF